MAGLPCSLGSAHVIYVLGLCTATVMPWATKACCLKHLHSHPRLPYVTNWRVLTSQAKLSSAAETIIINLTLSILYGTYRIMGTQCWSTWLWKLLSELLSYRTQGHRPRMAPHTMSVTLSYWSPIKKTPCSWILWWRLLNCGFLLSDSSGLCHAAKLPLTGRYACSH